MLVSKLGMSVSTAICHNVFAPLNFLSSVLMEKIVIFKFPDFHGKMVNRAKTTSLFLMITQIATSQIHIYVRVMQKKWTFEFLSGRPLERCQYVKKHLCSNFGQFGHKLQVASELLSFNGKMHCKHTLFSAVFEIST